MVNNRERGAASCRVRTTTTLGGDDDYDDDDDDDDDRHEPSTSAFVRKVHGSVSGSWEEDRTHTAGRSTLMVGQWAFCRGGFTVRGRLLNGGFSIDGQFIAGCSRRSGQHGPVVKGANSLSLDVLGCQGNTEVSSGALGGRFQPGSRGGGGGGGNGAPDGVGTLAGALRQRRCTCRSW